VVVTASGTEHTTHKNEAKAEVMHGTLHARNAATPSTSLTYLHGARSSVNCSMNWSTTEPEGSSSLLPSHEVKHFNSVQFLRQERVSVHPVYAQHYPQSNSELPIKTLKALTPFPFMLHVPPVALSWFYFCGWFYGEILSYLRVDSKNHLL